MLFRATTAAAVLACAGVLTLAVRVGVDTEEDLDSGTRHDALFASNLTRGSMIAGRYRLYGRWEPPEKYDLGDKVGSGNFGITYKAHDTEKNRDVILKVFKKTAQSELLLSRSTATSQVHRNRIALAEKECQLSTDMINAREEAEGKTRFMACWENGADAEPVAYVALEFIEGDTLDAWSSQYNHVPPPADVIRIAKMMLEGLKHIEGKFVHRDIKGANVMVWTDNHAKLQLKFIDYGLAAPVGTKGVAGSLDFLPPEAIRDPEAYESQSPMDVYATGVTIYKIFCDVIGSFKKNLEDQVLEVDQSQHIEKFATLLEDKETMSELCGDMSPVMIDDDNVNNLPLYHFVLDNVMSKLETRLPASKLLEAPIFQEGYDLEGAANQLKDEE